MQRVTDPNAASARAAFDFFGRAEADADAEADAEADADADADADTDAGAEAEADAVELADRIHRIRAMTYRLAGGAG